MPVIGNAVVKISAESASFQEGTEQAKKKANGFFKELQANYGRQSTLAKSLKLLSGGGTILGIGLAAKEFEALGQHIKEITLKGREQNLTAGELADEYAKAIPILGKVYSGMKDIYGAVSGITGEIADIEADTKLVDAVSAAIQLRAKDVKDFRAEMAKTIDDLDRRMQGLGLKGPAKALFDSNNEYLDKAAETEKQRQEKLKSPESDKLRQQLIEARSKLWKIPTQADAIVGEGGFDPYGANSVLSGQGATDVIKKRYNEQKDVVDSLSKQLVDRENQINAAADDAINRISDDKAKEGMFHFKEIIAEKLKIVEEMKDKFFAQFGAAQNKSIDAQLEQLPKIIHT